MYDFAYQKPGTLADAVKALGADADARALAGGMTYIPVLKQRLAKPTTIVDLSGLGMDRHHGRQQCRDDRCDDETRGRCRQR